MARTVLPVFFSVAIGVALAAVVSGALLLAAAPAPVKRAVIHPADAWVCTDGGSCAAASDVRAWILRNGPGEDVCGH